MSIFPRVPSFFREYKAIFCICLGVRGILIIFSFFYSDSFQDFLSNWSHWDGYRYLDIAKNWYRTVHGRNIVWFPFYPLVIKFGFYFVGNRKLSAILISIIFSCIASILLFKLVLLDFERRIALRAVWFFNVFPTAFFLQAVYTESLYLSLSFGAIYCFRKNLLPVSAGLAGIASGTRLNGIFLLPLLLIEAAEAKAKGPLVKYWSKIFMVLAAASLGFLAYAGINYFEFHDAAYFLRIQSQYQSKQLAWPWIGIYGLITTLPHARDSYPYAEFSALLLGVAVFAYSIFRMRKSYAVFMLLNLLLLSSTGYIVSTPRYLMTLFPIYIALANIKNRIAIMGISLLSLVLLFFYTHLFLQHRWAF